MARERETKPDDINRAEEDALLLISGIQHFVFCRRQWALIHIEQMWAENVLTVEGDILHEVSHNEEKTEKRGKLLITRGMAVASHSLGITGQCDVVEFHADAQGVPIFGQKGTWRPYPVEYKRGRPKEHDADILQLCAQAMCLEDMLACEIPEGSLFYGEPHRRLPVAFTEAYRQRVKDVVAEMRMLYRRGHTPKVKPQKGCKRCSLESLCSPGMNTQSVSAYIARHVQEE